MSFLNDRDQNNSFPSRAFREHRWLHRSQGNPP
jgi:hypothetical protein